MSTGTVHTIAPDLYLIEGHHPKNLWDDPDLPTIVVYRSGPSLYLLDTGVGPEQRDAIRRLVKKYDGQLDEIVLLNSHGHLDHLGNNDVLAEIANGAETRHYFPREGRPGLDFESFFAAMYRRGLPYFDYLNGLSLPADGVASLLRTLGADVSLNGGDVEELATHIDKLGIGPALGGFLPSIVVDILLQTYPPVAPSIETMTDYEDYAEAGEILIGSTRWAGWSFPDARGNVAVQVLKSGGHSAGGVVFYLPEHRFMMLADETTSVPIWADSDPRKAVATARKVLTMLDEEHLTALCAGHRPMSMVSGDDARAAMRGVVGGAQQFAAAVNDVLARYPEGVSIDEMYDVLVREAEPGSIIALLQRLQFPVFSTFLKLTLLNHCLLLGLPEGVGANGRPTFSRAHADA